MKEENILKMIIDEGQQNIDLEIDFKGETIGVGGGGVVFIPSVDENGDLSWINNGDLPNPETVNIKGEQGEPGEDGISPTVKITNITGGKRITITDINGAKSADIMDGEDGKDGTSVTVKSVSESTADGGNNIVTFSDGKTVKIKNGSKGADGKTPVKGVDYFDGSNGDDGEDGISPTVAIINITGGKRITITDANGSKSTDIMDGKDGPKGDKGDPGEKGENGAQGPKGDKGDKGDTGAQGIQGIQGEKGADGAKGDKGDKGDPGADGKDGVDGKSGSDGYTPQKGVDYFDGVNGADGLSIYQYNGAFVSFLAPGGFIEDPTIQPPPNISLAEVASITIPEGRNLQVGDFLLDTAGVLALVSTTDSDYCEVSLVMNINGVSVTNVEQTTTSTADGGTNVITVTLSNGEDFTFSVKNGSKGSKGDTGAPGANGKDGVGIKSVVQTTTSSLDGGSNVITVTKTDNTTSTFTVKNGREGSDGKDGYTPIKGVDYFDGLNGSDGRDGADGKTPVKGVDYYTEADKSEFSEYIASELAKRGQLAPEYAESLEWLDANGDQSKMYVLPDGMIWAYMLTEKEVQTGGYDNRLLKATETYNGTTIYGNGKGYVTGVRLSSNGSISTSSATEMIATGFISAPDGGSLDGARIRTKGFACTSSPMNIYAISYNSAGTKIAHKDYSSNSSYINDFTLDSATYGTGIKYIRISTSINGTSPEIVTVNEEIKESGTEIIITEGWASTGHAFVPADYEDRIVELEAEVKDLNAEIATLNGKLENAGKNRLTVSEVFAPSPQLPADGSETADFNGIKEYITADHIYAYIDVLLSKYPRFLTKEIMGKDASGTHDWCRYVCSRRAYDAWQKPNYPPMYAWANGSTVIYSVSVSPRIGDTMYSTAYIGTAKGTVSAVSNANQSRTIDGVVYTRDKTKDVEPTLVYTETAYSPYFSSQYAGYKNGIYDGTKAKISTVSSMANGILTGANGVSYTRYPLGDRNSKFERIPAIVIGGNEHGTGGDPATPAMINARMIKDLCECKNADNPFINLLKNEYMMVFCPVVNPWGLHKDNHSYCNSNGVNLDRNFDTVGWMPQSEEKDNWNTGSYGGSENETQYFMNTLVAAKCKLAMCNHSYGEGLDYNMPAENREAVSAGICSYMLGGDRPKYAEDLLKIAEVMAANYNLVFNKNGDTAYPTVAAKTRSYFEQIGIDGIALEMQSRDGFITDGNGAQFTSKVMEAAYTQLLQVLYMMIDKAV